jgi:hypothetical protein
MAEFVLKYADSRGEIHQQVAEAASEQEVRDRFTDQGYLIYSIRARQGFMPVAGGSFRQPPAFTVGGAARNRRREGGVAGAGSSGGTGFASDGAQVVSFGSGWASGTGSSENRHSLKCAVLCFQRLAGFVWYGRVILGPENCPWPAPAGRSIPIAGEFRAHEDHGVSGRVESLVEAGGEEAGFEARGAEESLLGEGDALDGEEFLGVNGLVDGDEVGPEMGDFIQVLEADDGESGGGEAVFAGILGGAGLALRGAGSGGLGGIGAIGVELFFGDGFLGAWHAVGHPL